MILKIILLPTSHVVSRTWAVSPPFGQPLCGYVCRESEKTTIDTKQPMSNLRESFLDELADIYNAENQLLKALPKMAQAAEHEDLKEGFKTHLEETRGHVDRLKKVFGIFGQDAKGKTCKAMEGLIEEAEDLIEEEEGDAALICAAQKVEHYEIATYGTLKTWASLLGEEEAAELLEETLEEEKATDEKLTEASESINVEEVEEEAEEEPAKRGK